jgi:hypothetical protein
LAEDQSGNPPIISILAANEEDRFTSYLAALLEDPIVLNQFLDLSPKTRIPEAEFASLRTQMQVQFEGGRPDLVISGDHTLFVYEAKVGSWIHGNQLAEYARHLRSWRAANPKSNAALMLVSPSSQLSALVSEAKSVAGKIKVDGISWEQISDLASTVARKVPSDRMRIYLEDFAELIEYRLGEVGRPFTAEELSILGDRQLATALYRAFDLLPDVVSNLKGRFGNRLKTVKSNGAQFTGYDLHFGGQRYWFGIWVYTWAKVGGYPVCVQIRHHVHNDVIWPDGFLPHTSKRWAGTIVPLTLTADQERDELVSSLASQVETILTLTEGS